MTNTDNALIERLTAVEDRLAIAELLARYCFGIDNRDLATVGELFTPNARFATLDGSRNSIGREAIVAGFEKVKGWLQNGTAAVLVTASDAAEDGRRKLRGLSAGLQDVDLFTSDQLSLALGRGNVIHAALRDGGLARRFVAEVNLLAGYRHGEAPMGRPSANEECE